MISFYVLNVPENGPVIRHMTQRVGGREVGDYVRFVSAEPVQMQRREVVARRAVWFSCIGALSGGRVTRFDSETLCIDAD